MMKSNLTIVLFIAIVSASISCKDTATNTLDNNKVAIEPEKRQLDQTVVDSATKNKPTAELRTPPDQKISDFLNSLKTGAKLSPFFTDGWLLNYHQDNRCDGTTEGEIGNLKSMRIDSEIKLSVKNDGAGWACDKKEPKTFDLFFNLNKKVADWDRFEISKHDELEKNVVYIVGSGESDYLKLHYDENALIMKLEYRSEDPG